MGGVVVGEWHRSPWLWVVVGGKLERFRVLNESEIDLGIMMTPHGGERKGFYTKVVCFCGPRFEIVFGPTEGLGDLVLYISVDIFTWKSSHSWVCASLDI